MTQTEPSPPYAPAARRFRWRRLFQYRLRTLLILTAVVAVWLGYEARRADRQRQAVEMAERKRTLVLVGSYPQLKVTYTPRFFWKEKSDMPHWLESLADRYPNLLCDVTQLGIWCGKLTDADAACLANLGRLEELDLGWSNISDTGLAHLEGLAYLRDLSIWKTPVSDAGLAHLKALANLQNLDLRETQVTDKGLESLTVLGNLESLRLWRTRITDAGLVHLKGLGRLTYLDLDETQVSKEGVDRLQKQLPKCEIDWTLPKAPKTKSSSGVNDDPF